VKQIYDEIRGKWVAATPEELVRQTWLQKLILTLGYPKGFIAVEKKLDSLPHRETCPDRRADIVCYRSDLTPLLLIECKAEDLSIKDLDRALEQALGYNTYIEAAYVAVVTRQAVRFRYNLHCARCVIHHLPAYEELIKE
jgi:type I restriction enzyme M protein